MERFSIGTALWLRRGVQHGVVSARELGGYRLIRKLGEGPRAEVMLGYSPLEGDAAVAIKIFRPDTPYASVMTEIAALSRAAGRHVVELLDVAADDDGQHALLLARLPGRSLARLLRARTTLALGEAITILAPVATAISAAHRAGVGHGGIRAEAVAFDRSGAPVLACFGRAVLFAPALPPALLEAESATAADLLAFRRLAMSVLDAVQRAEQPRVAGLIQELTARGSDTTAVATDRIFDRLADDVLGMGPALPVRFSGHDTELEPARVPGRTHTVAAVDLDNQPTARAAPSRLRRVVSAARSAAPAELVGRVDRVVGVVVGTAHTFTAGMPTVRRRVWVAAGAVAVAILVALLALPSTSSNDAPTALTSVGASSAPVRPVATGIPPVAGVEGDEDDPVAALVGLFAARERCIRDRSVLCLDGVAQQGSTALAADQSVVRALQGGAELPTPVRITAAQVELTERLGDSAILALSDVPDAVPTTILIMKGTAGWRIRDYLG